MFAVIFSVPCFGTKHMSCRLVTSDLVSRVVSWENPDRAVAKDQKAIPEARMILGSTDIVKSSKSENSKISS